MNYSLLKEDANNFYMKDTKLLDPEKLKGLSPKSLKILRELVASEHYPKELAEIMDEHEQKIYYHIRKLRDLGLIDVVREERRGGAKCKIYAATSESFSFDLSESWNKVKFDKGRFSKRLISFFEDFVREGVFDGSIVVGSPMQHGPFLTSSRDGHYAVQLGIFLGNFCELEERFVVKLDTEVKAENSRDRNLILIGGPVTNMVMQELNDALTVRFNWENNWKIVSDLTGNEYKDENLGLIAKVNDNDYTRLVLSGLDFKGTKSAIIALTQYHDKILDDYDKDREFYRVIKGLDMDGDGKTDSIDVLE